MHVRKHTITLLAALLALLVLTACQGDSTPAPTATAIATMAAPTEAPTEAPTAAPAAVPPPTEELTTLRANPWQWVSFTSPVEQFDVATPLSYLVQFNTDATLNVVADCNNAAGSYQGEGGILQIELGPMTAAACPPDSRSDQFVKLLSGAALYFFEDGNLHIDLFADSGTMVFSPAPPDIFGDDGEGAVAGLPAEVMATLGNLSYSGLFDDRAITLVDGAFTETSDAETIAVRLLDPFVAIGDLNGDGSEDAVALLELDTSGSGRFTYMAPVLDVLTTPTVATAIMVEDRIQPTTLTIDGDQVVLEYVGHGEGDGECCPSWNIRHTFAWQDDALVAVSREEVSKVEAVAPASSRIRTDAWTPVACDTLGVAPELAAVAECGYVSVPENRATGSDKTIQLAVVRVPSTSDTPGSPVILGTGGPGGAGLQGATGKGGSTFTQTHAAILADRDWVFFTQRGSPQAQPELSCPAYNNVPLEAAKNGWSTEERLARAKEAMQACLDDFAAQGVDLTAYTSVENAADIDALRQALGYDKIIYYGESYGTLLGQYLLRSHPEIVDAIILDGIAPATATRWTDVTKINESFERVFDACAADEACHAAYPDPAGALAQALTNLKANPAPYTLTAGEGITVPLQVDDVLAMNALFLNLYIPGGYARVPAIVYQLSEGDYSALASTLPLYYANSSTARVMHMAIACSDDPIASLDEVNLDVPEMYKALILDDAESYATVCPMLGVPQLPDSSDALVESEIPALLLQGGLDPATPVSGGDNVATGLPNSYNIVVPAGSHIQSSNPCILELMAAFMRDPQAAPDTSCIDPDVPFAVPFAATVTSEDGSVAITVTLPATYAPYPGGKNQWFSELPALIGLDAFPAGTPVEDVLGEMAANAPFAVEIVDGPVIAGLPSKMYRYETSGQAGATIAFADAQGTYRINAGVLAPDYFVSFLEKTLPAILDTVQVGPAPAAAEAAGATAMDAISAEDLALFQQVAQEAFQRMVARNQEACPDATSRPFPLAEPDYNAKRPLDLNAFADALAAFDPARAEELDALLAGKAISEIQTLLDGGDLTSVELVTYYLDRIQRYDVDRLNSVIELNPQVLADAAAADAARSEGKVLGALHGIPVLLKDNIATSGGLHTTAGAYALKDWQPDRDAFLVQQLRNAGALVLGKANLSEWANYMDPCMPSGFSAIGGQTRNPYGPYETYGSSSGSGVAVGANFATVAVGSETSGSIIQPARVNSVVGMRPSLGLISREYVVPLGPHLDTPGPMGRSVTDVALLLNALKGVDENDPKTADAAALADVDFTQYLALDEARKVRVGVIMPNKQVGDLLAAYRPALEASLGRAPTDAELQEIAETVLLPLFGFNQPAALDALKAQGIEVVAIDDATLPWTDRDTAQPQLPYDFAAGVAALFGQMEGAPITSLADVIAINNEDPTNRAPYGQSYVEWSANNTLTAAEFARVQATAAALANTWMDTVLQQNDVDILVTGMLYSGNAGAAGIPALTIPNGLDANGRPQGIILSGPYLSDPQLIAVGYALEQALNGRVEPDLEATIAEIDAVTGK